jgi:hypothetical protein
MWGEKSLDWRSILSRLLLNFFYFSLYSAINIKGFYKSRWGR